MFLTKLFLLSLCFVFVISSNDYKISEEEALKLFKNFIVTYDKEYSSPAEFQKRFHIFKENLQKINEQNQQENKEGQSIVNKFADLTYSEFLKKYTGLKIQPDAQERHKAAVAKKPQEKIEFVHDISGYRKVKDAIQIPDAFDYRNMSVVTDIKDQSSKNTSCGSCWAFATIASVESFWAINNKDLYVLSTQVLIDCDDGSLGCEGGDPGSALETLINLGNVPEETDYPYTGKDGNCSYNPVNTSSVKINSYQILTDDEEQLAASLVQHGPLIGAMAVNLEFMVFKGNNTIFDSSTCPNDERHLNHAVVLVGYGVDNVDGVDKPYWILRNSWGTDWADAGYAKFARNKGLCGINLYAWQPTS